MSEHRRADARRQPRFTGFGRGREDRTRIAKNHRTGTQRLRAILKWRRVIRMA